MRRLYVSYSKEDNSSGQSNKGWTDEFVFYLDIFLQRLSKKNFEVVAVSSENDKLSLTENDCLVCITSEEYFRSKGYKDIAKYLGDSMNHSRIFKVEKSFIPLGKQPVECQSLMGYPFFGKSEDKSADIITLDSKIQNQSYWLKIIDLAFDVFGEFMKLDNTDVADKKVIYLAETSIDQIVNRDRIRRELQRHGYTVLPDQPLSADKTKIESEIKKHLSKSILSIHLVGEDYGNSPTNSERSVVEIQNTIANEHGKSMGKKALDDFAFFRFIWMPMHIRPSSDQQKLYIDQLKDELNNETGAELIQTPLEVLKTLVHGRIELNILKEAQSKNLTKEGDHKKMIYLLFDMKDQGEIAAIKAELDKKDIEVITPIFEGGQLQLLEQHRQNLLNCDAVLLYANNNLNWLNSKLSDVIKAPGFGRTLPFEAKGIYVKGTEISKDKIPNISDLMLLNGTGDKSAKSLEPFVAKFNKS